MLQCHIKQMYVRSHYLYTCMATGLPWSAASSVIFQGQTVVLTPSDITRVHGDSAGQRLAIIFQPTIATLGV